MTNQNEEDTQPGVDVADTEPPAPLCGKKRRDAGHVLHCEHPLDHKGRCSFEEDFQP